MAGWVVRASGDVESPDVIRSLFAELGQVLRKAEHGTGSSEFNSAHIAASNFHEPTESGPDSATGEPGAGAEGESPAELRGGVAKAG